jgi:hypothetical protein
MAWLHTTIIGLHSTVMVGLHTTIIKMHSTVMVVVHTTIGLHSTIMVGLQTTIVGMHSIVTRLLSIVGLIIVVSLLLKTKRNIHLWVKSIVNRFYK